MKITRTQISIIVICILHFLWSMVRVKLYGDDIFSLPRIFIIAFVSIPITDYIEFIINKNKSKGE